MAALGDTLFPAESLREAFLADASPASHLLIRLRVLHPALAIGVGLVLHPRVCPRLPLAARGDEDRHPGATVAGLAALQLGLGFVNVMLLAPVWMQLVHLLVGGSGVDCARQAFRAGARRAGRSRRDAAGGVAVSAGVTGVSGGWRMYARHDQSSCIRVPRVQQIHRRRRRQR